MKGKASTKATMAVTLSGTMKGVMTPMADHLGAFRQGGLVSGAARMS